MADSAHRKHGEAAGGFLHWARVALYHLVQWYPGCHVIEARNLVATFQCSHSASPLMCYFHLNLNPKTALNPMLPSISLSQAFLTLTASDISRANILHCKWPHDSGHKASNSSLVTMDQSELLAWERAPHLISAPLSCWVPPDCAALFMPGPARALHTPQASLLPPRHVSTT